MWAKVKVMEEEKQSHPRHGSSLDPCLAGQSGTQRTAGAAGWEQRGIVH